MSSTNPNPNPARAEAERLLGVAEKLLNSRDLPGSREFALLALETDSLLEGSEQILAIADVLLASEKRVNNNRHHDWYSILQTDRRSEPDLLRKNYRRLALLLHPDKNNYPLADSAFKLVADAWAVLSDPSKRTPYDHELTVFSKVDLRHGQHGIDKDKDKLPVRRSPRGGVGVAPQHHHATPPPHATTTSGMRASRHSRGGGGVVEDGGAGSGSAAAAAPPSSTVTPPPPPSPKHANVNVGGGDGRRVPSFWTACPYCYVLYEYERVYKEYCVRCQNCERSFQATAIRSMPPRVPGKEAYYCCWGFYPLGFSVETESDRAKKLVTDNNNVDGNATNNVAAATVNVTPTNNNNNGNVNVNTNMGFPNWMPGMFNSPVSGGAQTPQNQGLNMNMNVNDGGNNVVDFSVGSAAAAAGFGNAMPGASAPGARKRGRPRKNPLGM